MSHANTYTQKFTANTCPFHRNLQPLPRFSNFFGPAPPKKWFVLPNDINPNLQWFPLQKHASADFSSANPNIYNEMVDYMDKDAFDINKVKHTHAFAHTNTSRR